MDPIRSDVQFPPVRLFGRPREPIAQLGAQGQMQGEDLLALMQHQYCPLRVTADLLEAGDRPAIGVDLAPGPRNAFLNLRELPQNGLAVHGGELAGQPLVPSAPADMAVRALPIADACDDLMWRRSTVGTAGQPPETSRARGAVSLVPVAFHVGDQLPDPLVARRSLGADLRGPLRQPPADQSLDRRAAVAIERFEQIPLLEIIRLADQPDRAQYGKIGGLPALLAQFLVGDLRVGRER